MTDRVRWDLSGFARSPRVEVSFMVRHPVQPRDFAICVETDMQDEFLDLNPSFVLSESLAAPYRYLAESERGAELVPLGTIAVPAGSEELALVARPWAKRAAEPAEIIALAVVVAAESAVPRIEHVLIGTEAVAA